MHLRSALTSHPIQQFRKNRRFYLHYDAFYLGVGLVGSVLMSVTGFQPLVRGFSASWLLVFPALVYFLICCHLWIHNATHGNFPRAVNRVIGEVLGVLVFVRFASWDIVHMRHHRFSDDAAKDPHPTYPSFWRSFLASIFHVERQLQQQYFDTWGDTPDNRRSEAFRARVSYGTNIVLAIAWYLLLGPVGFFVFFFPANVAAAIFVGHFNWSTHNGERGNDFRPVNLNHGYYLIGNKLFTGIYFHANHHKRPHLFNPAHWDEQKFGVADPPVDAPSIGLTA